MMAGVRRLEQYEYEEPRLYEYEYEYVCMQTLGKVITVPRLIISVCTQTEMQQLCIHSKHQSLLRVRNTVRLHK